MKISVLRLMLLSTVAVSLFFSSSRDALADNVAVSFVIAGGGLSLTVTDPHAPDGVVPVGAEVAYSTEAQTVTSQVVFIVDDARVAQRPLGWQVVVSAADLVGSAGEPGPTVRVGITNITEIAGTADGLQIAGPSHVTTGRSILTAAPGAGAGRYEVTMDVTIEIPGSARPGSYAGALQMSVLSSL